MSAEIALCAWALAACAAGVLASRRYGEGARCVQLGRLSQRQWTLVSLCALAVGAAVAVVWLDTAMGIAYWLSALAVFGAAITGIAAAAPRAPSLAVWMAVSIGLTAMSVRLWTT